MLGMTIRWKEKSEARAKEQKRPKKSFMKIKVGVFSDLSRVFAIYQVESQIWGGQSFMPVSRLVLLSVPNSELHHRA